MNCLLWNCRGANKPNFRRSIRYILKKCRTDVLALFETHAGGDRAGSICQGLGFDNSFRVDADGQSGGLWLLWRTEVGVVTVIKSETQFIYATIVKNSETIHLIVVYAAPSVSRRSGIWNQLDDVLQNLTGPVIIGGDFNTIVRVDERTGGNGQLSPDSLAFGEWINNRALIDMGFMGPQFTWKRGREERFFIAKRLDRVFCNAHTRLLWQEATVRHLPFLSSDHTPLYVQLEPGPTGDPKRWPFRFEAAWLKHPGFKDLLVSPWDGEIDTPQALEKLKLTLRRWNREVFGDIQRRKEKLLTDIKSIQNLLDLTQTDALLEREGMLLNEFDVLLAQEETLWFQKSREKWIVLGDRNTKYYHTTTIIKRRRNRIEMLTDDGNQWVTEPGELEKIAIEYYRRLYSMEDVAPEVESLHREELMALNRPFRELDVEQSVRSMGRFKAPGPDGFQPIFYQENWEVVKESVTRFVLDFFRSGNLPVGINDAIVVLIPKVLKPERITQFRPISLCNVLFKTITKTIVMKLKKVMPKLIGPAQSSFIPGRLSMDNIVVVQEAVHSMRRKKGVKGWMLLKLDLEKAYDRIRWDFLKDTLQAAQLPKSWVGWIMTCVSGPDMSILWNGEQMAVTEKKWKPIRLSRGGPNLSHVCFADNLILFAEASVGQIRVIRGILEKFCVASGQKVSLEKSKIFFSENVSRDMGKLISDESGIGSTRDLGKYLGMPVLQKRINKDTFADVLEKVSSRLAGWRGQMLSFAGRITLTRSVLSSIPVHIMSTIVLPQSIVTRLDKVARAFLWGDTEEKRRQHLVSWEKVCTPKPEGGLGIRQTQAMNKALVAKLGWRLIHEEEALWARVLRCKYGVKDVRDNAWFKKSGNWSSTWRSILKGMCEVVIPGLSWVVGDGRNVRFWQDRWLSQTPLLEEAMMVIPQWLAEARASEMWVSGSGWNMPQLEPYIPDHVRLQLGTVVLDEVTGAKDRTSWGHSSDGVFTVKSAYTFLTRDDTPRSIMTDLERQRRHLSDTGVRQVCKGGEESILHILRDCPAMAGIWNRIVPARKRHEFFATPLLRWVHENLVNDADMGGYVWSTIFAMGAWWGWKWRCWNVFGHPGKCRDRVKYVKDIAQEVTTAHQKSRV
ncbi:unnamed protein product [Microthlaspi erraticum]|uniref:Reverse transcriptase domain-containing protein n=1 Tax=Microthlaspi erraticum TaxID=1685480 RepID=A0A6D2KE44_9BRAS|nr:unnamed protein product [Microthlaspi erraticum]